MAKAEIGGDPSMLESSISAGTVIVATLGWGEFKQIMLDGRHVLHADEPVVAGGGDTGPGPYELILMALGSCTSMTVHLYAAQRKWPLDQVVVTLSQERAHVRDCANCEAPGAMIHRLQTRIEFIGSLDQLQRARLREVADRCPVPHTLTPKIEIRSALVPATE